MYKVINKENGQLYNLEFDKLVYHNNIKDSYMMWNLSLVSDEELESITITQYYFMETLEMCLLEYGYIIAK